MDRPSLWMEDGSIRFIDQRLLPGETVISDAGTVDECVEAISTLAVRGAPAIGVFGASALALSLQRGENEAITYSTLLRSRPTAVDLRNCMDIVMRARAEGGSDGALEAAVSLAEDTISRCRRIGEHGSALLKGGSRVLTHCNAGALATLDWGTALAPVRMAARSGRDTFVWVSETRPLFQGSRLTAWELSNEGIDHTIVVDAASAYLMKEGSVDLIIVGADRVAGNGDVANKIGTLDKALLASRYDIPFYAAFPGTTFDPNCPAGDSIPIEIRSPEEVSTCMGMGTAPSGSKVFNPAFDVTPSELVTGYITPHGILEADELKTVLGGG